VCRYGDPAFKKCAFLWGPFPQQEVMGAAAVALRNGDVHDLASVASHKALFNAEMAKLRISVENFFAILFNQFK
jgi:hypothetical protein